MNSRQDDISRLEKQVNIVVTSFLDGHLSFEKALERLAVVLRAQLANAHRGEGRSDHYGRIEFLEGEGQVISAPIFPVAQGRSSADQQRAGALLQAAMKRIRFPNGAA